MLRELFLRKGAMLDLLRFWITPKEIFCQIKNVCYQTISNKAKFSFMEKNSEKKKDFVFCFFSKIIPYF